MAGLEEIQAVAALHPTLAGSRKSRVTGGQKHAFTATSTDRQTNGHAQWLVSGAVGAQSWPLPASSWGRPPPV